MDALQALDKRKNIVGHDEPSDVAKSIKEALARLAHKDTHDIDAQGIVQACKTQIQSNEKISLNTKNDLIRTLEKLGEAVSNKTKGLGK